MLRTMLPSAGNRPPAATGHPRRRALRAPPALPQGAFAVGVALAAAVAAGQRSPALLAVLGLATLAAAAGASLLRRQAVAAGAALAAASPAVVPVLGPGPCLYLVAGAVGYGVLYARWLEPRTPLAVVVAGASVGCAALAGWQTAASTFRPTPLLVAAVIFLWIPGHLWSQSIAAERDHRAAGSASLAAVAGAEQTAAAVFAVAIGLVTASLVLAPRLPWPYAALAVPAGACLLAATRRLRRRADTETAALAHRLSSLYLAALLAGLALSAL